MNPNKFDELDYLKKGDILHRMEPVEEDCELTGIIKEPGKRIFIFRGFIVPHDCMDKMFIL